MTTETPDFIPVSELQAEAIERLRAQLGWAEDVDPLAKALETEPTDVNGWSLTEAIDGIAKLIALRDAAKATRPASDKALKFAHDLVVKHLAAAGVEHDFPVPTADMPAREVSAIIDGAKHLLGWR